MTVAFASLTQAPAFWVGLPLIPIGVFVYFAPVWIALTRHAERVGPLIAFNGLLGFTIIGWFFALAFAFKLPSRRARATARPPGTPSETWPFAPREI